MSEMLPENSTEQPVPAAPGQGEGATFYGQSVGVQGSGAGVALRPDITSREEGAQIMQQPYIAVAVRILEDHDWCLHSPNCQGIVAEIGGATSHASVVSREENIPCLLNAQGASSIKTGDQVEMEVSGAGGEIHVNGGGSGLEAQGHGDPKDTFVWCNQSFMFSAGMQQQIPEMITYMNSFGLWNNAGITGTFFDNGYAQIDKYPQAQEQDIFEKWLKGREPELHQIGTEPPVRGKFNYSPRRQMQQQQLKTDLYRFVWWKDKTEVAKVNPEDPNQADTTHNYLLQKMMGELDPSDMNLWTDLMENSAAGIVYDDGSCEIFREKFPGADQLEAWVHAQFPEVTHIQYVEGANPFGAAASVTAMENKIISKLAAEEPWRGLTAFLGDYPYLVIYKEGNTYFLEGEDGSIVCADFAFNWEEPRVETNRLVAATRSLKGNPTLLSYDPEDGSWLVIAESSGLDVGSPTTGPAVAERPGAGGLGEPTIEVRAACPHCHSDQHLELMSEDHGPHTDEKKYACHNCGKWSLEHELEVSDHDEKHQDQNPEDVDYEEHDDDAERHQDDHDREREVHDDKDKFEVKKHTAVITMPYPGGQGIHNGTSAAFAQAGIHATVSAAGLPQPIALPFTAGNMFIMIKMFQAQGLLSPGTEIQVDSDNPELARQIIDQQAGAQASVKKTAEILTTKLLYPNGGIHNNTVSALGQHGIEGRVQYPPEAIQAIQGLPGSDIFAQQEGWAPIPGGAMGMQPPGIPGHMMIFMFGKNKGFDPTQWTINLDTNNNELAEQIIHAGGFGKFAASTGEELPSGGPKRDKALKCPNCGSHTVEAISKDDEKGTGQFVCLSCGNTFDDDYRRTSAAKHPNGTRIQITHPTKKGIKGSIQDHAGTDDSFGDDLYDILLDNGDELKKVPEIHFTKIKSASVEDYLIVEDEEGNIIRASKMQKGAPYPEKSYENSPDHSPKGQDWPAEVNAVYNACMREGNGDKEKCARIAWAQYKKTVKEKGHGTTEEEGKAREKKSDYQPNLNPAGLPGQQAQTPPCPHCGSPTQGTPQAYSCPNCGYTYPQQQAAPNMGMGGGAVPGQTFHSNYVKSSALDVGQWYTMYSPDYKVPDVIQVVEVNDHGVTANIEGDDKGLFPITLPHSEIEEAGYRFEPYSNPSQVVEAKVARRQFSATEQADLINENLDGLARNFHKLNLEGTHYPQEIEASVDPLNEEFWLW